MSWILIYPVDSTGKMDNSRRELSKHSFLFWGEISSSSWQMKSSLHFLLISVKDTNYIFSILEPGQFFCFPLACLKNSFFKWLQGADSQELAAASKLEDDVNFYQTTSPDVAKIFHIDPKAKRPSLVLLKKEAEKLSYFGMLVYTLHYLWFCLGMISRKLSWHWCSHVLQMVNSPSLE